MVAPDQFFGIILMLVLRQGTPFETPSDLVVALKEKLTGRVLEKGEEFHVEVLIGVREFWSWLAPIGITLHNAFVSREHIVAPHAFSYKLRQDLSPREKRLLAQEGGRGGPGNDHDVMCVYKLGCTAQTSRALSWFCQLTDETELRHSARRQSC